MVLFASTGVGAGLDPAPSRRSIGWVIAFRGGGRKGRPYDDLSEFRLPQNGSATASTDGALRFPARSIERTVYR